ncbi:MAG: glucosaminidase domain-containing protein, partial [Chloroflexi bacterium]|nr:glucosaminidase domain-containing protein [Chloroflexota bacterium]
MSQSSGDPDGRHVGPIDLRRLPRPIRLFSVLLLVAILSAVAHDPSLGSADRLITLSLDETGTIGISMGSGSADLLVVSGPGRLSARAGARQPDVASAEQGATTVAMYAGHVERHMPEGADPTPRSRSIERIRPTARGAGSAGRGLTLPPGISPERARFLSDAIGPAQASALQTGVPASVILAQAILESDWGQSRLAREGNNYFGIKAGGRPGPAGIIRMGTWEHLSGANVAIVGAFRAYTTMEESFVEHGRYFLENSRYVRALQAAGDPREFARRVHQAGYATDPSYAAKLINIMDKFNLYAHDVGVGVQGS